MLHLINITQSPNPLSKWRATFITTENKEQEIVTDFGSFGFEDYTIHHNIKRANWYRWRHWRDLRTKDPTRAGYLSMFLLWNKKNGNTALRDYQKRLNIFNLTGEFPIEINDYVSPFKSKNKHEVSLNK